MNKFLASALAAVVVATGMGQVQAGPCSGNDWQPTFVHDLEKPDGPWFVNAGGGFTKLPGNSGTTWVPAACKLIATQGVRGTRGFTTCQDYTRIQCGCTRSDRSNSTCAAFLQTRP
jgi:hypothetical protein